MSPIFSQSSVKNQLTAVITEHNAGDGAGSQERGIQDHRHGNPHPGDLRMEKPHSQCSGGKKRQNIRPPDLDPEHAGHGPTIAQSPVDMPGNDADGRRQQPEDNRSQGTGFEDAVTGQHPEHERGEGNREQGLWKMDKNRMQVGKRFFQGIHVLSPYRT